MNFMQQVIASALTYQSRLGSPDGFFVLVEFS